MSRVIAAYDLDEDHGRLWVNADLKRIPDVVIVANQPMDRAQTVTYVPEARLLEAMDAWNQRVCTVDESDEELYLDIAQGLFDDLMAVDEDKAKLWARAWPELFGKDEDGCDLV